MSRRPCSGGPLGQVLSRGGVPGPGGIVLLIGVALGEIGRDLGPVRPHWSLAMLQSPLPDPPGATLGSPTPWHPDSVPPAPPCRQYQCRSALRPPHGHSCAVPTPQRGSRSARSQSLCSACHPARWARSPGRSGFCPRGAGLFHSPAPSRPRCRPAGPSCHHILSPSVQHATPPADRHTGWARRPAEPGRGLQWKPPGQKGPTLGQPRPITSTHLVPQGCPQCGAGLWMTLKDLGPGSRQMAPQMAEGFA